MRAVVSPMPLEAPVITMTCSVSGLSFVAAMDVSFRMNAIG
jgi:hypothetical protein